MNISRILAVGASLLFVSALAHAAPESAPASKPSTGPAVKIPPGFYSILAGVAQADDAQRAKIKDLVEAEKAELVPLEKKLDEAKKAAAAAKEKGDKEAAGKADDDRKAVQVEINKVTAKTKAAAMAVLTPAQRETVAAHDLAAWTKQRLGKTELTEAQDAKIKELAPAPGKKIMEANGDPKAINEIRQAFLAQVKEQVLTADQRKALESAASGPRSKPASTSKAK